MDKTLLDDKCSTLPRAVLQAASIERQATRTFNHEPWITESKWRLFFFFCLFIFLVGFFLDLILFGIIFSTIRWNWNDLPLHSNFPFKKLNHTLSTTTYTSSHINKLIAVNTDRWNDVTIFLSFYCFFFNQVHFSKSNIAEH